MLVDQHLAARGSHTACTRNDIRNAYSYLTSPRVQQAVWTSDDHLAMVRAFASFGGGLVAAELPAS